MSYFSFFAWNMEQATNHLVPVVSSTIREKFPELHSARLGKHSCNSTASQKGNKSLGAPTPPIGSRQSLTGV